MEHRQSALVEKLTPREEEVLSLLREGLTNGEIAHQLGVGPDAAKYHVSQIISKLGVRNRYQAAAWPQRPPWWLGIFAPIVSLRHRFGWLPQLAIATAVVALAAGAGLLLWGLMRTNGDGSQSPAESAIALVHIGGTIDSISDQKLVLRDLEGHLVNIRLEHAEGPEAQFCDHRTPIPMCMVLSDAAPTVGERVCILAHLTPPGDLLAWFVNLDSQCQQAPAPTTAATAAQLPSPTSPPPTPARTLPTPTPDTRVASPDTRVASMQAPTLDQIQLSADGKYFVADRGDGCRWQEFRRQNSPDGDERVLLRTDCPTNFQFIFKPATGEVILNMS